jgi:hypothetical protein
MIKDVLQVIASAARKMVTNWGASLILFVVYALLLAVCYSFFTTGEATAVQVFMTILVLPVAAVVLFFVLQAMGLSYVRIGVGPIYVMKRAWKDFWKLLLVSLPLILLFWLAVYLFGKLRVTLLGESLAFVSSGRGSLNFILNWAQFLVLWVVFPLIAIHLWISAIGEGVGATLSKGGLGRSLKRAFSPRSVLIYIVVLVVFGVVAYLLFFTRTFVQSEWTELWLFGARLAAALVTIFLGWLLALGSMAEFAARGAIKDLEP